MLKRSGLVRVTVVARSNYNIIESELSLNYDHYATSFSATQRKGFTTKAANTAVFMDGDLTDVSWTAIIQPLKRDNG